LESLLNSVNESGVGFDKVFVEYWCEILRHMDIKLI